MLKRARSAWHYRYTGYKSDESSRRVRIAARWRLARKNLGRVEAGLVVFVGELRR